MLEASIPGSAFLVRPCRLVCVPGPFSRLHTCCAQEKRLIITGVLSLLTKTAAAATQHAHDNQHTPQKAGPKTRCQLSQSSEGNTLPVQGRGNGPEARMHLRSPFASSRFISRANQHRRSQSATLSLADAVDAYHGIVGIFPVLLRVVRKISP